MLQPDLRSHGRGNWATDSLVLAMATALFISGCIVLGGSSRSGVVPNAILQSVAAFITFASLVFAFPRPLTRRQKWLIALVCLAALIPILQLVPLPEAIWAKLPGRQSVSDGFSLLNLPDRWMPITLDRDATIAFLLGLLPSIAIIFVMLNFTQIRQSLIAMFIVGIVSLSALLSIVQILGGADSPFYLYSVTSLNAGVGFFANSNHQASLCLMTLPIVAAIGADRRIRAFSNSSGGSLALVLFSIMGLLALSIVVTKSRFGLILLIPVLIASIFIFQRGELPKWAHKLAFLIPAFALFTVVAGATLVVVARVPVDASKPRIETRSEIWGHTFQAIDQYFPVGSGVGTFVPIYARYQPPARLNDIYVNHAHNDYLELLLEEGVLAAALIIGAFAWFFLATVDIWRSQASAPFKRAATISVFVVLIHSFVEYPARTAAIASILAYSAAVIAARPRTGGPIRSQ